MSCHIFSHQWCLLMARFAQCQITTRLNSKSISQCHTLLPHCAPPCRWLSCKVSCFITQQHEQRMPVLDASGGARHHANGIRSKNRSTAFYLLFHPHCAFPCLVQSKTIGATSSSQPPLLQPPPIQHASHVDALCTSSQIVSAVPVKI